MKNLTQKRGPLVNVTTFPYQQNDTRRDSSSKTKKSILIGLLFISLVISAFSSKAQTGVVQVTNISGCNWTVTVFNGGGIQLDQFTSTTTPPYTLGVCVTGAATITLTRAGCSTITFVATAGVFTFQSVTQSCCSGNSATCSEAFATTCGAGTHLITLNIN